MYTGFQSWGDVIVLSLTQSWVAVASFIPLLIGAIVVFLIGWIVAVALGTLVEQVVKSLRVDSLLEKLEVEKALERGGMRLNSGAFIGGLVKWFLVIVFLLAAVNILQLGQVSEFLNQVLLYIPNVVIAALILIIAAIVSDIVERILRGSLMAMGHRGSLVAPLVHWSIWVFALIAALLQLGIAVTLIQTLVTGLVAAIAIAAGLAFGLGGKDAAAQFIDRMRNEMRK